MPEPIRIAIAGALGRMGQAVEKVAGAEAALVVAARFDRPGAQGEGLVSADEALAAADVVIAHAGVGAALEALDGGRRPLLVPRLQRHGEHVDDHQLEVARELGARGLALVRAPEELSADALAEAARGGAAAVLDPPPLELD